MGLFDTFFGKHSTLREHAYTLNGEPKYSGRIVTIGNFVGEFERSPGGRWTVAWADRDPVGHRGGHRPSGNGTVVLLDDGRLVYSTEQLERPNDGKVADDGTVAISDWLFDDGLSGVFYVFAPDGSVRMRQTVSANLNSTGIAPDGSLACVQACVAESDDGGKLSIFEVSAGRRIAHFVPTSGWAKQYRFEPATNRIWLQYPDSSQFAYSLSGEFLDEPRWRKHVLGTGDYFDVMHELRRLIDGKELPWPAEVAGQVLPAAARAAGICTASPAEVAKAWKYAGMAAQSLGQNDLAREHYERAMKLSPRAGVKKLLAKL